MEEWAWAWAMEDPCTEATVVWEECTVGTKCKMVNNSRKHRTQTHPISLISGVTYSLQLVDSMQH